MKNLFLILSLVSTGFVFSQVAGESVEINWNGSWYKGKILEVNEAEGKYYISYDGYDSSWNEWVTLSKLRGYKKQIAATKAAGQAVGAYKVGEKVKIKWNDSWYDGKILKINPKNKTYYISYDGYASSWNEWVKADRLKKKD